ncbi:MAG: hypothetical protein D6730_16595 [Bacteroidetes bacterium]|nr:MAG: hypothetical protein D6730_16595 [Bacteroidota bacterium]
MAKKAQVQIELEEGGRVLSPFSQLVILQYANWHHSFEIRLPMRAFTGDGSSFAETSEKIIGKPLKIGLKSLADSQSDDNFFRGIITEISMSRFHGATNEVILRGQSPTIMLEDGINTRSFSEKDLKQVAEQVLNDYPKNLLKTNVKPASVQIPYVVQHNETNYHFLSRMAARYGEWFYYDGTQLNFAKPEGSAKADMVLGKDLVSFDIGLKLAPVKFKLKAHDYLKDETYDSQGSSAKVDGLNPFGDFLLKSSEDVYNQEPLHQVRIPVTEKSELDDMAKRRKSYQANEFVHLRGVSDNIGVKIGATLNISASWGDILNQATEDYKEYLVIEATHRIDGDGNYQNQFVAIPASVAMPPKNPHIKQPFSEPQTAVVKENHDPEKLGRLRVQFYWQEDPEMTPWIRCVMPHGGGKNGFFFMPEVGDEVIVDFIEGSPDAPFVNGCVYHSNAKPADNWQDPDNYVKALKTASGNEIRLTDKGGEEEIKIINPDSKNEITLSLSGDGSITIKSVGNISISADKSMSLTANDMSINVTKKISVNCEDLEVNSSKTTAIAAGTDYTLDSGAKMAVSSGTDFELTAGTNAKISAGANLELSATANGKISANANMDVEGQAMTNVKSSGITSVQGSMIKLN